MICPVILAGGVGKRLQPLSTPENPKQFHALQSDKPMIIETILRVQPDHFKPPVIISHHSYKDKITSLCNEHHIDQYQLILEEIQKNTCPAIMLAVLAIEKQDTDAIIIVLPTDHYVDSNQDFIADIESCVSKCGSDNLIVFGACPITPETEYGYIQYDGGQGVRPVINFTEKPDFKTAETYTNDPCYLWNCGIVMGRLSAFICHFNKYQADLFKKIQNAQNLQNISPLSFDCGILEKSDNILVKPISFEWYDMGHWKNLDKTK